MPRFGAFTAYKKASGKIVTVEILVDAKRSNATGRKCRAEAVRVIAIDGDIEAVSPHDASVVYRVGEIVRCHEWNPDRWTECGGGIHFFLTREEAEDYCT